MNITVIRIRYEGLVTGTCLPELGNTVTYIYNDWDKIAFPKWYDPFSVFKIW